ncbi:FDXHR family putative zinc-binding protein [Streptomyces asiaticus]
MTHPETPIPVNAIKHPQCGQWWTGLGRAHCAVCHRTFSCDSAADKHRKGAHGIDRHCVDPATVGLVAVRKPWGDMWQNPGNDSRFANSDEALGEVA